MLKMNLIKRNIIDLKKIILRSFVAAILMGIVSTSFPIIAQASDNDVSNTTIETKKFTDEDVIFLREEEKLARDVYLTLYEIYGLRIFDNISQAEQRHMNRLGAILDDYNIEDPIKNDKIGVFTNTKLADLYKALIEKGSKSEVDALLVGATIEDLDIHDIITMKERTKNIDVLDAFEKLECGSRNHMRAFTRQLSSRDASYTPQYLSVAEVDAIIAGDHERCGQIGSKGKGGCGKQESKGCGNGKGNGRGQGRGCGN